MFLEDIREDIKRYNQGSIIKTMIAFPACTVVMHFRICNALAKKNRFWNYLFIFEKIIYRHLQIKYGISLAGRTVVGKGLCIPHFGGIVINPKTIIGSNVTIFQNVTIGENTKGVPRIGDNVVIGANSVLIGDIIIGDNCIIAAGSVVCKSVAANSIIKGSVAQVINCDR